MKKFIAASALMCAVASEAMAEIKVGILHSLSGTMAISETTLKDTMLMLIEQQNAKGGLLGEEIVPVVVDPASDWPLFAEKARELLTVHEVDVIFGNWTSVSRKSVLPVIEELNGLLFYPVQYEGEESSKNVFYTGAAPNQQAIPATDYYLEELGVEKFALLGTDYVYPRTTNKILEQYLKDKGIAADDIFVNYTPFGHSDWSKIVADVALCGADRQEGRRQTAEVPAMMAFSVSGRFRHHVQHRHQIQLAIPDANVGPALKSLIPTPMEAHLSALIGRNRPVRRPETGSVKRAVRSRHQTAENASSRPWATEDHAWTGAADQRGMTAINRRTRWATTANDPMRSAYIGFNRRDPSAPVTAAARDVLNDIQTKVRGRTACLERPAPPMSMRFRTRCRMLDRNG